MEQYSHQALVERKKGRLKLVWSCYFPDPSRKPGKPCCKALFWAVLHISRINPLYRPSALKSARAVKSLRDQYKYLCGRSGTSLGAVLHAQGDVPSPRAQAEWDHHMLSTHSPNPASWGEQRSLNTPRPVPA